MFLSKCGEYYYIYFTNPSTGKRTKISTKTKSKTQAYNALMNFNPKSTLKNKIASLTDFKEEFLKYSFIHYSLSTHSLYERSVRQLLAVVGNIPIRMLNILDIEGFKRKRIEAGASKTTVNMEFRTIRSMLNFAIKWGLIDSNPCNNVKQFKVFQKEILAFDDNQIKIILNNINSELLKNFVLFALLTGCRLNEITQLQWRDLNLSDLILTIRNKPNFKIKSGNIRELPISSRLLLLISNMYEKKTTGLDDEYVFHNESGYPFVGNYLSGLFKSELRKLDFPERFHFHCLRHTFITQLVRKGVNIHVIKRLAGHSEIETTELYMHSVTDDLRRAVELI